MIDRAHIHTQIHSTRLKNSCTFEGCAREKQEIEDGSKQGCVQGEGSGGEGVKATQEARKSGGGGSIVRPVPQSRASTPAATTGCCPGSGGRTKESSTPSTALDQHSIFCPPVFHSTHTHAHTHTHTHKTARRQAQCTRAHLHVCALCFGDCAVVFISCGNLLVEVLGDASEAFGEDVKVVLHLELLLLFCKDLCVQLLSLLFQILQT